MSDAWVPGQPNVKMERVADDVFPSRPGHFHWISDIESKRVSALVFADNRGRVHVIPVAGENAWGWDGNENEPTITPSILSWNTDRNGNRVTHWHGFVRAGVAGFEC